MTTHVPRDVWIGLVMLVCAGLYWFGADGIPISPLDGAVNAAAMPKALAYGLAACAILLIVRTLSVEAMARGAAPAPPQAPPAAAPEKASKTGGESARMLHLRAAGVIVIGIGYLLVLYTLGYAISAALLIIAMAIYVGAQPSLKLVAIAAALAAGFHVIFVELLGIPLPPGLLAPLLG